MRDMVAVRGRRLGALRQGKEARSRTVHQSRSSLFGDGGHYTPEEKEEKIRLEASNSTSISQNNHTVKPDVYHIMHAEINVMRSNFIWHSLKPTISDNEGNQVRKATPFETSALSILGKEMGSTLKKRG